MVGELAQRGKEQPEFQHQNPGSGQRQVAWPASPRVRWEVETSVWKPVDRLAQSTRSAADRAPSALQRPRHRAFTQHSVGTLGLDSLGLGSLAYGKTKNALGRAWCLTPLIPAKLCEFRTSLIYISSSRTTRRERPCLRTKAKSNKPKRMSWQSRRNGSVSQVLATIL